MSLTGIFALGFVCGAAVIGLAFCVVLIRYRFENTRMSRAMGAMDSQYQRNERFKGKLMRALLDSNTALELSQQEVDKLRDEKLHNWDIPDGLPPNRK